LVAFTNLVDHGGSEFMKYNNEGALEFTKEYEPLDIVKSFNKLSPRFSMSYAWNENSSLKLAFAKTHQFLHLMSNSSSSNPTDVWMPSGLNIPPKHLIKKVWDILII